VTTTCKDCPLGGATCPGYGPDQADVVIVGEAPGQDEVRAGRPFIGQSGRLLDATLEDVGLSRTDIYVTNTTQCRPTQGGVDAPPPVGAIAACSDRLVDEVRARKPKIVIAMGNTASQRLLHTKDSIGKVQGVMEWSDELGCFVLPTYHPAAVLHGSIGFFDDIWQALRRVSLLKAGKAPMPPQVYDIPWTYIDDPQEIVFRLLSWLHRANEGQKLEISLDTESISPHDGPRPSQDEWIMMQCTIGPYGGEAKATCSFRVDRVKHWVSFKGVMQELLRHDNIVWDYHNVAHDHMVLRANIGYVSKHPQDSMAFGLCMTERQEQVGLKAMSRMWLNAPYYEKELTEPCALHNNRFTWGKGPQCECHWYGLAKYGAYDAYNTRTLCQIMPPLVELEGTMQVYHDILLPAQLAFARVRYHGTLIDQLATQQLEDDWLPIIEKAEHELQGYAKSVGFPQDPAAVGAQKKAIFCPTCVDPWFFAPETPPNSMDAVGPNRRQWRLELQATTFGDPSCKTCMKRRFVLVPDDTLNVRSFLQLQHLAFDILHLRKPEGKRTTDASFLALNVRAEMVQLLERLREKDHLLRTYVRGLVDDIWDDGRVHPDFMLGGAKNGRLSVKKPPVQTWPKWGTDPQNAKLVRKPIVASPGHVLVDADYSQLELYASAMITGDEVLYRALTEPEPGYSKPDFHRKTASAIFAKPYDDVTGLDRFNTKFVVFGIAYGRQAYSLAQGELFELTGGDERLAQAYIDRMWGLYPKWRAGYDSWQYDAVHKGELITPFGRKRRWRLITPATIGAIKNQAANYPPASTGSDICLSAFCRLAHRLPNQGLGNLLFTVHDSLVAEIRKDRLDEGIRAMQEEMTVVPFPTPFKLQVGFEIGPNLGEVHDYEIVA
jgi:uracil-DNA glycosylase family 4